MNIIKSKKKLGQHFLNNLSIAKNIVKEFNYKKNILEIGPGTGVLTNLLVKQEFIKFVAIDIDSRCIKYLEQKTKFKKVTLINQDILKVDFRSLFKTNFSIIGNLPYNISSQILFKILENRNSIDTVVIMLQKEVAERILSLNNSRKYGILSVLIQTYFKVSLVLEVEPKFFEPSPKINSSVLKLKRNHLVDIGVDFNFYKKIIKGSFQSRRKTLRNALKNLNLNKNFHLDIFSKRAEQLSVNDFIWLANFLKN